MKYQPFEKTLKQVQFFNYAEKVDVINNPYTSMNLEIRCDDKANTLGYVLVIRFDLDIYKDRVFEDGVTLITARKTARLFKSIDTAIEFLRVYGIHDVMVWSTK